jgi:hypothetical protein
MLSAFTIFSQFLILHETQDFDLRLLSPRHPGHGFLFLVYARHRRQFIPQGAISDVGILFVLVDLIDVMPIFHKAARGLSSEAQREAQEDVAR